MNQQPLVHEDEKVVQQDPGGAWVLSEKNDGSSRTLRVRLPDGTVSEQAIPTAASVPGVLAAGGSSAAQAAPQMGMNSTMQHIVEAEAAVAAVSAGAALLKNLFGNK